MNDTRINARHKVVFTKSKLITAMRLSLLSAHKWDADRLSWTNPYGVLHHGECAANK